MNLSAILDIAITLIFIYLILSLLSSEIQEIIAALLQWRAKNLKKAIETLLGGSVKTEIQSQTGEENPLQPLVAVQPEQPTNEETLGQLPTIKEVDVKKQ